MTIADKNSLVAHSRRITPQMLVSISPLPPPEEVLADWLMTVAHEPDIEAAARRQIALIDRRAPLHPDVQCLRALLVAIAGATYWQKPISSL